MIGLRLGELIGRPWAALSLPEEFRLLPVGNSIPFLARFLPCENAPSCPSVG
jgi:hypothetical protein